MKQGAHVLILDPSGALILQQRDNNPGTKNPGTISAWGGGVEEGNPIDTAIREMHEELSLKLRSSDLTFWRQYCKTAAVHTEDLEVHLFILNYRIDPSTLTVNEGAGYCIVRPDDELDKIKLTPLAKQFVRDFFADPKATSIPRSLK